MFQVIYTAKHEQQPICVLRGEPCRKSDTAWMRMLYITYNTNASK